MEPIDRKPEARDSHTALLPSSFILCCFSPRLLVNCFNPGSLFTFKHVVISAEKVCNPHRAKAESDGTVEEAHTQLPPVTTQRDLGTASDPVPFQIFSIASQEFLVLIVEEA